MVLLCFLICSCNIFLIVCNPQKFCFLKHFHLHLFSFTVVIVYGVVVFRYGQKWPDGDAGLTREKLQRIAERNRQHGIVSCPIVKQMTLVPPPRDLGKRIPFGRADNIGVYSHLFGGGGLNPCILRRCDMKPFTDQRMQNHELDIHHLALATGLRQICTFGVGVDYQRSVILAHQQVIAETLVLHEDCMNQNYARAELLRITNEP